MFAGFVSGSRVYFMTPLTPWNSYGTPQDTCTLHSSFVKLTEVQALKELGGPTLGDLTRLTKTLTVGTGGSKPGGFRFDIVELHPSKLPEKTPLCPAFQKSKRLVLG